MSILGFIFSIRGIAYLSAIALLVWLLKGYPQWRSQKQQQQQADGNQNDAKNDTTTTHQNTPTGTTEKDNGITAKDGEKLSLAHYVLVSPFAALYIVGRAVLDTLRYSLYYALWACERSIPYIDDWLFEFVTVSIPKGYQHTEKWWQERGKPACIRYKNYLNQHLIPATVQGLEAFFVWAYKVGCAIGAVSKDFIAAWRRFVDRHDWRQLATDLGEVAYKMGWVPVAWIVTRTMHLCKIIYTGVRGTVVSIAHELHWLFTVAIPSVVNYVTSTRLARLSYRGLTVVGGGIKRGCLQLNYYVLEPTLGRLLNSFVRSIDALILLLQQRTLQEKLARLYRALAPHVVWALNEVATMVNDCVLGLRHLYSELIHPAYRLFMKHVMPRLKVAYQAAADNVARWYEAHLYPAWLAVYPYLNTPLLWLYMNLTLPVYREIYSVVSACVSYLTQQLAGQVWAIGAQFATLAAGYAQSAYAVLQSWLLKQAPVLAGFIEKSYETLLHACNWEALYNDVGGTLSALMDWIAAQSNAVYLSLERSLGAWANEQLPEKERDDAMKKQKVA